MKYRVKRVEAVKQGGGTKPTRYNITFEELNIDGKVIGEYAAGCDSDLEDKVKEKISEFFKQREKAKIARLPHTLEGKQYEEVI